MTFSVDTDRLHTVAAQLTSLEGRFRQVAESRVYHDGYSDSRDVDAGLDEFLGKWTDGMTKLQKELEGLARALDRAADAYDATEADVGRAAGPSR